MASSLANIKLSDLTKTHQECVTTYYPIVENFFLGNLASYSTPGEPADQEFTVEILKFLRTMDIIFGESLPKPVFLNDKSRDLLIIESALQSFRLYYRREFDGNLYLTEIGIRNSFFFARSETIRNIQANALKFSLTDKEITDLKEIVLADCNSEEDWIREVNNFKKDTVLGEIKAKILENVNTRIYEELPHLVGETVPEFYDTIHFRQEAIKLMSFASKSFQEQIPYEEHRLTHARILKDFDKQVIKIVRDLATKNRENKYYAERIMATYMDSSLEKYSNAIGEIFKKEEPLREVSSLQIQHEILQELHIPILPIPNTSMDPLRSKYLQLYFKETDGVLQKLICQHGKQNNTFLDESSRELFEVLDRFVDKEVTQVFETHKIPIVHLQRIRETLNDQLQKVIGEIKELSIANPEVAETVASGGNPISSGKMPKKANTTVLEQNRGDRTKTLDSSVKGSLLHFNIRLFTGKTYKIYAFNYWTVKMLRQELRNVLGTEYVKCFLYHKCKKLQDENFLQSYNIQDGDFLIANI